jgi:xanthine dehydrogenase accessory factor
VKHWHETAAILDRVARIAEAGSQAAIATVVRISGSAYRRPGAKLLVSIVAEMLAVHAGREPGHLRARRRGIHEE